MRLGLVQGWWTRLLAVLLRCLGNKVTHSGQVKGKEAPVQESRLPSLGAPWRTVVPMGRSVRDLAELQAWKVMAFGNGASPDHGAAQPLGRCPSCH